MTIAFTRETDVPDPDERAATRGLLALALLALLVVVPPVRAQTNRELLDLCLDVFEGERRRGRLFTGAYGRHVLECNYQVDMLDGYDERRVAYERWRTERHEQELARMAARPARAPRAAPAPRAPVLSSTTERYAQCLRQHADRLAVQEPDLATDARRARQQAELLVERCLDEVGLR